MDNKFAENRISKFLSIFTLSFLLIFIFPVDDHTNPIPPNQINQQTTNSSLWECWGPDMNNYAACRQDILSIKMLSSTDGWALSRNGWIIHWDGIQWRTAFNLSSIGYWFSFAMVSDTDGWIVGYEMPSGSSLILHWNGNSWNKVTSPNIGALRSISMLSTNEGWIGGDGGNVLLHWNGNNWSPVNYTICQNCASPRINTIDVVSSTSAWASGTGGAMLHWDGSSWTETEISIPIGININSIDMLSETDGWAVGDLDSVILHWDGITWNIINFQSGNLYSISMSSPNDGWAVGSNYGSATSLIYHWNGNTWSQVVSPGHGLLSIAAVSESDAWAMGLGGTLLHWDGASWELITDVLSVKIMDLVMISPSEGWAVGYQTILHWDGVNWSNFATPSVDLWSIAMNSGNDGWAVGRRTNTPYNGVILHWNGINWAEVSSPSSDSLYSVDIVSTNDVWVVGSHSFPYGGMILHWDGNSWTEVSSPTTENLFSIDMISATDGWILGEYSFLRWNGNTWSVADTHDDIYYAPSRLRMFSATEGWAGSFYIYHWNGSRWLKIGSPAQGFTHDFSIVSPTDVWMVNDLGGIFHWDGTSWNKVCNPSSQDVWLSSIKMQTATEGWAMGLNGLILRFSPDNGSSIIGQIKDTYGSGLSNLSVKASDVCEVTTDTNGYYAFNNIASSTYTIFPNSTSYSFTPPFRLVNLPPDSLEENFIGTGNYIISGRVVDSSGNGIADISISDGAGHATTTDGSGNYSLGGLGTDTYVITPFKNGSIFSPPSQVVNLPPDAENMDFIGLHQPVVFIPGIMGSNLYDDNGKLNWFSAANVLPTSYFPLFLDSSGLSPSPDCLHLFEAPLCNQNAHNGSTGMIMRVPVNASIYADLVAHFVAQGYIEGSETTLGDFWVYNYDWRKNITLAADNLDTYINTILSKTKATQVVIIAHSMGGLVARQYVSNQARAAKISQLITIGTPYLGTPKAFAVLQGLDCAIKDLGPFGCLPDKGTVSGLAHNFPAFHELLPSQAYFTAKGSGFYSNNPTDDPVNNCLQCLNFSQTYQSSVATNINPALMTNADEFHQNLDNNASWNGVPLTVMYGTYQNTIAGFQKVDIFSWSTLTNIAIVKPQYTLNGDDTVTTLSALMSGLDVQATYLPFSDIHGGLVNDPLVFSHIDNALGLNPLSTTTAKSPQQLSSNPTGVEIQANGVKAIDVIDAAGNHTGPQAGSNIIEESIPGSSYFNQDDFGMVALLGSQNYTITLTPSGLGPADISLARSTPSGTISTQLYTGIPTSSQSRIRMIGDPYQINNWQLDVDGSGNHLQTIDPTLTYTGDEPEDKTPPLASIQIQGNIGPNGWYTNPVTVTLSATDNPGGSGVNRIEYAFGNDRTPRLYTGPFIADPNLVTMLYVIATDLAGNKQTIPTTVLIGPEKVYLPYIQR